MIEKTRPAVFFASKTGPADKKEIGEDIGRVEYGAALRLSLVESLGDGLWQVRTSLASHRIARVLFTLEHSRMILLHGFIKKTQKTPDREIKLARRRRKDWEKANV